MTTRQELEQQGYTFHQGYRMHGYFFDEDNSLHSRDMHELLQAGWILMPGGIMEPPQTGATFLLALGMLGAAFAGMYLISKHAGSKESVGAWLTR